MSFWDGPTLRVCGRWVPLASGTLVWCALNETNLEAVDTRPVCAPPYTVPALHLQGTRSTQLGGQGPRLAVNLPNLFLKQRLHCSNQRACCTVESCTHPSKNEA